MNKQTIIETLNNIVVNYGNKEVSFSVINTELGIESAKLLKTYGELVSTGIYNLPPLDELSRRVELLVESVVTPIKAMGNRITTFNEIKNLIPTVNAKYVPFGCYNTILRIVTGKSFLPAYIVGESGNGKSESIRQACAKSKRELVYFNVTNETTEEDLMGSFILEDGNMVWKDGPVIIAMRRGAVLLLDECDNLSTSAMTLQSVLQNEPYYVKKTNEMVEPQEGFTVVATANTKGDGDGGDRFIGANVLNEAFLERFNIVYTQEYPPLNIEMKILQNYSKDNKLCAKLVRWANVIRKGYYDGSIERCLTTRRLIQIVKNISVLKSDKDGIEYALNRFDEATKKAMMLAYESLSSQPYDDGLDELAGTMADVVDADGLESAITANSADVDDSEFKNKMQTDYLSNNPDADKIRKELEANFI